MNQATPASMLLIGATGPTGALIVDRASAEGMQVAALARDPSKLNRQPTSRFRVVRGDVLDVASLTLAMQGVNVVVSVLGTPLNIKPVSLLSVGTQNIVTAMKSCGVKRFICITGMGAGDSRGHGGFVYDRLILTTLLKSIYADKDRQERVVQRSDLDWVIVRPARLTNGPSRAKYREITHLANDTMTTIARADVAHFVVHELRDPRYHQATVNLTD